MRLPVCPHKRTQLGHRATSETCPFKRIMLIGIVEDRPAVEPSAGAWEYEARSYLHQNTDPRYREHHPWPAVIPSKGFSNGCTAKSGRIVLPQPFMRTFC